MLTEILSFVIVLILGLFTSIEDIRTGKIRNFWIVIGFFYSFFLYLATEGLEPILLTHIASNTALSFLTAYIFWKCDLWSAGDAKLFFLYAILLPARVYKEAYLAFFPSAQLLVYTFIPATTYLLILSLIDFFKDPEKGAFMSTKDIKKFTAPMLRSLSGFAFIFFFNQIFWSAAQPHLAAHHISDRILFLGLFLAYKPMNRFFSKHKKAHLAGIGLGFLAFLPYLWRDPAASANQFARALLTSAILIFFSNILRSIIQEHIRYTKEKTMPFAPWLFLGILLEWFANILK